MTTNHNTEKLVGSISYGLRCYLNQKAKEKKKEKAVKKKAAKAANK